jgi:hypothetical protein
MSAAAAAADQIWNQTPDRLQGTNTKCGGSEVQAPRLNVARPGQQARSRGGLPIRSCARQEKAAIACALPLGGEEADAGRGGRRRTVGRATRRGGAGVGGEERGRVEVNYSYSLAISPLPVGVVWFWFFVLVASGCQPLSSPPLPASTIFSAQSCQVRRCLDPFKLPKILQDFSSHRIFRRMHGVLNVGKKITNYTVCL